MHGFENGGEGRARPRVLYACRSVPYARVGRAPLDESVQRRIQTAYPDIEFDWPRLLKEAAASAPRPEKPDKRDEPRKGQRRERARKARPSEVPRVPQVPLVPQVQFDQPPAEPWQPAEEPAPAPRTEPEPEPEPERTTEPREPMEPGEPAELVPVPFEVGPLHVDRTWPVVGLVGEGRALVLRGRYIEIAHRVLSRVDDEGERGRLLAEAARLNPEGWNSADAARAAIEGFDAAYEALAARLRQQPA
jgi:hypothetical protein